MKILGNKFLNCFLSLLFCATVAVAQEISEITLGVNTAACSGPGWSASLTQTGLTYTLDGGAEIRISGTSDYESFYIPAAGVRVTLQDAYLTNNSASPIYIASGGELTITLKGTNHVKIEDSSVHAAAISVPAGAKLTLEGENDAYLFAFSNGLKPGGAGIGSDAETTSGDIIITGGTIVASGGYNAASIGSGYGGNAGSINISGGAVIGHTIGSGSHGGNGNMYISGGTVYTTYFLGRRVDGVYTPMNLSDGALIFSDDQASDLTNSQLSGNAVYYVGDVNDTGDCDVIFDLCGDTNGGGLPGELTGKVVMRTSIVVNEGSKLIVPKGVILDAANYPITCNGEITAHTINGDIVGPDAFGDIVNASIITSVRKINKSKQTVAYRDNGNLRIEGTALRGAVVTDICGQTRIRKSFSGTDSETVNIESLPHGIYLISIASESGKTVRKIIK
jgi:hypothetical protein